MNRVAVTRKMPYKKISTWDSYVTVAGLSMTVLS